MIPVPVNFAAVSLAPLMVRVLSLTFTVPSKLFRASAVLSVAFCATSMMSLASPVTCAARSRSSLFRINCVSNSVATSVADWVVSLSILMESAPRAFSILSCAPSETLTVPVNPVLAPLRVWLKSSLCSANAPSYSPTLIVPFPVYVVAVLTPSPARTRL